MLSHLTESAAYICNVLIFKYRRFILGLEHARKTTLSKFVHLKSIDPVYEYGHV